jgi:hypothetical protein
MPFHVTIVSLIFSITLLLFGVWETENSGYVAVFPPSRSSKGESFGGGSGSLAVFSLQITAKTAAVPKVSEWAAGCIC